MMTSLRKWFFAGLLVLVPLAITIWLLEWAISSLDKTLLLLPQTWQPDNWLGVHIPGFGVILTLVVLLSVGALVSNFLGKRIIGWWDALLGRIPVVRSIYSSVKQVSDTLFSENGNAFRQAVLVEWPRQGVWTIGFVTGVPSGDVLHSLQHGITEDYLSVYVPTTPNPTSGYMMMFKKSDCQALSMSVDEALKYVVSMGVVSPT
ncbi:MAG: DUF502 domain-containing protein [Cytophagales bacterium]|nr:DUF502 domain-containing protein [Cytophagales bacterium]